MRRLIVWVLVTLISSAFLQSQTPSFVYPSSGLSSLPVTQQVFRFKFDGKIDSSSVFDRVPINDTVMFSAGGIYILPKNVYDTLTSDTSLLRRAAFPGTVLIYDDSTLQITLDQGNLLFNSPYKILVADIRVIDVSASPADTLTVIPTSFNFTTVIGAHRLENMNVFRSALLHCNDTLTATFSRPLPGTSNGSGVFAEIEKLAGDSVLDSANVGQQWETVASSLALSADSTVLRIIPSSLSSDTVYRVNVYGSRISGDSNYNVSRVFQVIGSGALTFATRAKSSNDTVPSSVAEVLGKITKPWYKAGDSVRYQAPAHYGPFYFSHWESGEDDVLDSSSSTLIIRTYSCDELRNISATAVYGKRSKDTVAISVTGSSYGNVRVSNFVDSLGGGVYTVYRGTQNYLIIAANANTACRAGGWTATGLPFNGSTQPVVRFSPGSNYTIPGVRYDVGIGFTPSLTPPCTTYILSVRADGATYNTIDPRTPAWPADIAVITPTLAHVGTDYVEGVEIVQATPITQTVTVTVTNDCYTIKCVKVNSAVVAGSDRLDGTPVGSYWTGNFNVSCQDYVVIYFIQKTFRLTSEVASTDATIVDPANQQILRSPQGVEVSPWTRESATLWKRIDEYACATTVEATPINRLVNNTGQTWTAVGWYGGSGYTTTTLDVPTQKLTFVMNQNRKIRYQWKCDAFLLTRIGVLGYAATDKHFTGDRDWRWFDVAADGTIIDDILFAVVANEFEGSDPNRTVKVKFTFNRNVKDGTLLGNLTGKDLQRQDFVHPKTYQNVVKTANNEATLTLTAADGKTIWCMGDFTVNWTTGIHSDPFYGPELSLSNPGLATTKTSLPMVEVTMDRLKVFNDDAFGCFLWFCDDPDVELTTWAGMASKLNDGFMKYSVSEDIIKTEWEDLEIDDTRTLGYDQGNFVPWSQESQLQVYADAVDSDEGYATTADMLSNFGNQLASVASGTGVPGWVAGVANVFVQFAAEKLRADEKPDPMNIVSSSGSPNASLLWGGKDIQHSALYKQNAMANSYYEVLFTTRLHKR